MDCPTSFFFMYPFECTCKSSFLISSFSKSHFAIVILYLFDFFCLILRAYNLNVFCVEDVFESYCDAG